MHTSDRTSLTKLLIWGASGHALVVADIVRLVGLYEIVAFYDDHSTTSNKTRFQGLPVMSNLKQIRHLRKQGVENLLLAIGHCHVRLKLAQIARREGFELATAIHPKTIIANDVTIGKGCVIVGGAVINAASVIGENVLVNTSASVDHECIIEDGAHIGPGAHLGGRVRVGRATWVGIGAIIKDRVSVGEGSIVGAGAVVLKDVPKGTVVYGMPAKVIRNVLPNEN